MDRRSYNVRLIVSLVVYAALLTGSSLILANTDVEGVARTAIGMLPVIPMAYIVWLVVARFQGLDEYWQRIQLAALPFAFLGTMLLMFTWGFLENLGFDRLNGFVVFGVMNVLYVIGLVFSRRRYS